MAWFTDAVAKVSADPTDRVVNMAVSVVTRKLGKADLDLTPEDFAQAAGTRPGWVPLDWSVDQAARVTLLLASFDGDAQKFLERFIQLCRTADVGELAAFYRGLPLYPEQAMFKAQAAEGLRTNIRAVFEAIAHNNPYASEHFAEGAWNQMVLKALFVGATLYPIVGLDNRANTDLSHMLCDYAEERWSASRAISPELWRCVAMAYDERSASCLERALAGPDPRCGQGAALALSASPNPQAHQLLTRSPALQAQVEDGALNWPNLA